MTGPFPAASAAVTGAITPAQLAALPSGSHTVFVHGQGGAGGWGPFAFATLVLDKLGPAISGPTLTPALTSGAAAVALHATGNDTASGGASVVAAEFTVDAGGPVPMAVNLVAPIASLDAVIPVGLLAGLAEGIHPVAVRARDALGNWGPQATITLTVDRTGPSAAVTSLPSPVNGLADVRVTATAGDPGGVTALEGFIDPVGTPPPGTGFVFAALDGAMGGTSEAAYTLIPQAAVAQLAVGIHAVAVRARDAAGNWGPLASALMVRSGVAVADAVSMTATTGVSQFTTFAAPGLLANDLPGLAGRTAALVTDPVRTSGTGTGTIRVSCGTSTTSGVCADGSYRVTLTSAPTATTGATRQASKRGTYQFTYRMTLNGVPTAPAIVTVTVN